MSAVSATTAGADDLDRCVALARAHYENFAVGSLLMPRRLRAPLAACYAVMRLGDDLVDDGVDPWHPDLRLERAEERAHRLAEWQTALERAVAGEDVDHFALRACARVVREHALPLEAFRSLFRAFLRDTRQQHYADFDDLRAYCRDSADPVGRLVLALFGVRDERLFAASDTICTGLQLVNHWQDVASDARRGRIYLPLEDLRRFGVDPESVARGEDSTALRECLAFEVARARRLLEWGGLLVAHTHGRLRVEVALFRRAGLRACDALERAGFAVMDGSPRLGARDRLAILAGGLRDAFLPRTTAAPGPAPAALLGREREGRGAVRGS